MHREEITPLTDEQASALLKDAIVYLELYRAQRARGYSPQEAWQTIQAIRSRSKVYDYGKKES